MVAAEEAALALVGAEGEGVDMVIEDNMGREGSGAEIQEHGGGGSGPPGTGSGSAPPDDGRNASGGLRLPLGGSEPLKQPSGNTCPTSKSVQNTYYFI